MNDVLNDIPFVVDRLPTNVPKECAGCGETFRATSAKFCGTCQITASVIVNHYTELYMRWKVLYE